MRGRYDDIIDLPCPLFPERRHMDPIERAAQFAPFAALTGFEDEIAEKARFTERRIEQDEGRKEIINERLQRIAAEIRSRPGAVISYFSPDCRKSGGTYLTGVYRIKKIEELDRLLISEKGDRIPLDDITDIELL